MKIISLCSIVLFVLNFVSASESETPKSRKRKSIAFAPEPPAYKPRTLSVPSDLDGTLYSLFLEKIVNPDESHLPVYCQFDEMIFELTEANGVSASEIARALLSVALIKNRVLVKDPENDYMNLNPYASSAEIILFGYTFLLALKNDVALNINLNPIIYYFMTSKLDPKDLKEVLKITHEEIYWSLRICLNYQMKN